MPRSGGVSFVADALDDTFGLAGAEFDDVRSRDGTVFDVHGGYRLKFVEAYPPGGARVDIENRASLFNARAVAVAEHDHLSAIVWSGMRELMDEMEAHAAEFEILAELKSQTAKSLVVVAVDGVQRGD